MSSDRTLVGPYIRVQANEAAFGIETNAPDAGTLTRLFARAFAEMVAGDLPSAIERLAPLFALCVELLGRLEEAEPWSGTVGRVLTVGHIADDALSVTVCEHS